MKSVFRYLQLLSALSVLVSNPSFSHAEELRIAVIGGLERSGDWARIKESAEEHLTLNIATVIAAPKEQVIPAFMSGDADALLIHGGDETFALESLGYGSALRTWGYNEFVFVGPEGDPAGISKARSGQDALQKIQTSGQPLISFRDPGSHQILKRLMDQAGLVPGQLNLLHDSASRPQQILRQAKNDGAYVIVGHIPVASGRMPSEGVRILLQGDPAMRRAYVIVTPGIRHPATPAARSNAEKLARYLLSDQGQQIVGGLGPDDKSWLFPRSEATGLLQFGPP